jgi:CRP/FNR family cyclic AMP-dependent transcriptional regulator
VRYYIQKEREISYMDVSEFFKKGAVRRYGDGQIVLYQGEDTNKMFYIVSGYIKVYDVLASGDEKILMILGPGDIFPVIWTFKGTKSLKYFYETYEEVELKVISSREFKAQADSDFDRAKSLLSYFVDRMNELMLRIESIEASSAKHKIAQVLLYLARTHGKKIAKGTYRIRFAITHQTLANMAGVTRETASIQLKELESAKNIINENQQLIVHTDRVLAFLEEPVS